jgi:hypothetical protein
MNNDKLVCKLEGVTNITMNLEALFLRDQETSGNNWTFPLNFGLSELYPNLK